jgi:hypothetical protein
MPPADAGFLLPDPEGVCASPLRLNRTAISIIVQRIASAHAKARAANATVQVLRSVPDIGHHLAMRNLVGA